MDCSLFGRTKEQQLSHNNLSVNASVFSREVSPPPQVSHVEALSSFCAIIGDIMKGHSV